MPIQTINEAIARWQALGRLGVLVSVAYGPTTRVPEGLGWTVIALHPITGREMETPFEAKDLMHAIEIAEREAVKRGWVKR